MCPVICPFSVCRIPLQSLVKNLTAVSLVALIIVMLAERQFEQPYFWVTVWWLRLPLIPEWVQAPLLPPADSHILVCVGCPLNNVCAILLSSPYDICDTLRQCSFPISVVSLSWYTCYSQSSHSVKGLPGAADHVIFDELTLLRQPGFFLPDPSLNLTVWFSVQMTRLHGFTLVHESQSLIRDKWFIIHWPILSQYISHLRLT